MNTAIRLGITVVAITVVLLFSQVSFAFRCGTRLISEGDHLPRVLDLCGDPNYVETWQEERIYKYHYKPTYSQKRHHHKTKSYKKPFLVKKFVTIERWTYNLGSHRLVRHLVFENGILVRIRAGEHGY